jgi:subtilisin family serine protease
LWVRAFDERKIDAPINSTPSLYPPQVQTRINELHNMGVYGQGVKLAIIDSGIDCSHPALGKGFGPGFKIAFGKNMAVEKSKDDNDDDDDDEDEDDSIKPQELGGRDVRLKTRETHPKKKGKPKPAKKEKAKPKKIDNSPCTQCPMSVSNALSLKFTQSCFDHDSGTAQSHGTHVAGIIAASDAGFGFMGVAPNVTLGMYREFKPCIVAPRERELICFLMGNGLTRIPRW